MPNPLDAIPPSETVRQCLAENIRQGRRLRTLLRLAVQTEQDRAAILSLEPDELDGGSNKSHLR